MRKAPHSHSGLAPAPAESIVERLCRLGWQRLAADQALAWRGGPRDVLLKPRLVEVLQTRRYAYKGEWHALSASGIEQIVRELSAFSLAEGLLAANERLYNQLAAGITVTEFMPDGRIHRPTIAVIDWDDVAANRWDLTVPLTVQTARGEPPCTTGVVGFVNGLPLAVIEAGPLADGIRTHLRHQQPGEMAALFVYAQLLVALDGPQARYATTGTPPTGWANWHEEGFDAATLQAAKNAPPDKGDPLMIGLLAPARLLAFLRDCVLFGPPWGKAVASSRQFFEIRAARAAWAASAPPGTQQGLGDHAWHTVTSAGQGPDEHRMTLLLLAQAVLRQQPTAETAARRLVVVTDQPGVQAQLLRNAGLESAPSPARRALTGRLLAQRIGQGGERLTVTPLRKFNTAVQLPACRNASPDVIVLIDDAALRDPDPALQRRIQRALPHAACLIVGSGVQLAPPAPKPVTALEAPPPPADTFNALPQHLFPSTGDALRHAAHEPQRSYEVHTPFNVPDEAAFLRVLREVQAGEAVFTEPELIQQAQWINRVVRQATAEHSLNRHNAESAIRNALLPPLFQRLGLARAMCVVDQVIEAGRRSQG